MLLSTSCSSEEFIEQTSGDAATVSFMVNTEGASATRAISDGTSATKLYYAVYDANGKLLEEISKKNGVTDCSDLTTTNGHKITLSLVKGQEYTVAFWAQDPDAPYSVVIADNNQFYINMNYDSGQELNNNEKRDAFFGKDQFTVMGNAAKTVTLKRPFAQINVGTSDKEAAVKAGIDVDNIKSQVVIKNAATTLDVISGDVSGDDEVTYAASAHPTENLSVNQQDYTWLSMCYVLPAEKENSTTVCTEFTFKTGKNDITLSDGLQNIPIQRNYRTNVIGSLLTNSVDFKVVIDKNFENPDHVVELWDGLTTEQPQLVGNTYEVANAAQWAWLSSRAPLKKDVKLVDNIDFAGHNATMLYPDKNGGTFDGNGKSIRNATYVDLGHMDDFKIGLFSFETFGVEHGTYTIKNLTIENVKASNSHNDYGYASALVADLQNSTTLTIDGVTVKNANLKGVQSVGAIVGFLASGSTVEVSNTSVVGNTLSNFAVDGESGFVCGLVGRVVGTLNIGANVQIKNNTIDAFYAPRRGAASIGEVACASNNGIINGSATTDNNHVSKNELTPLSTADLTISTAAELVAFANEVNNGTNLYIGKVIALANDIDLAGINWNPICPLSTSAFRGTFDGRGYTISNMSVSCADVAEGTAGFFGWINGTVKNVNFKTATVEGSHYVGVICGYNQFGQVLNCKVVDSSVNAKLVDANRDGDKCGGAIGYVGPNATCVVKDITVSNSRVTARRNAAQVIGYCYPSIHTIDGLSAINVTVNWNGDELDDGKDGINTDKVLYRY